MFRSTRRPCKAGDDTSSADSGCILGNLIKNYVKASRCAAYPLKYEYFIEIKSSRVKL